MELIKPSAEIWEQDCTLKDIGCYSIMTLSYLKRNKNG